MSKRKTSTFYLTERLNVTTAGTAVTANIDLGAYVDVGDRQGIAIEEVEFIWQGVTTAGAAQALPLALGGNGVGQAQVFDLNRGGTEQFADDRALVGSGQLVYGHSNYTMDQDADIYPDVFGSKDGVRLVVNDQLYCVANWVGSISSNEAVSVTVRIKAHIATLSAKDWMAIAIQSTAADN